MADKPTRFHIDEKALDRAIEEAGQLAEIDRQRYAADQRKQHKTPQVVVKTTLLAEWSYVGYCLRCHSPIGARGMAEAGARFDYRLVCQKCNTEHVLEVSVG